MVICMFTLMLKNHLNGCHGNHELFHSAKEFIFDDKNYLHFRGPNDQFGTNENCPWGYKVGQISTRSKRLVSFKWLWCHYVLLGRGHIRDNNMY